MKSKCFSFRSKKDFQAGNRQLKAAVSVVLDKIPRKLSSRSIVKNCNNKKLEMSKNISKLWRDIKRRFKWYLWSFKKRFQWSKALNFARMFLQSVQIVRTSNKNLTMIKICKLTKYKFGRIDFKSNSRNILKRWKS